MISRAWITINPVLVETVQCLLNIGTYWHMNPRSQNYPQETNEFDVEDNFKFVPYSLWHIPKMKLEKLIYCHHKHVFPKRFPALSLVSWRGGPGWSCLLRPGYQVSVRKWTQDEAVDAGWGGLAMQLHGWSEQLCRVSKPGWWKQEGPGWPDGSLAVLVTWGRERRFS